MGGSHVLQFTSSNYSMPSTVTYCWHCAEEALGILFVILDAFIVCLDRLAQRYLLQETSVLQDNACPHLPSFVQYHVVFSFGLSLG